MLPLPGADPRLLDPGLPASGQVTPVSATGMRDRRRMVTGRFGTGKGRVAIVARAGRVDHYECLPTRRYPGLESFRLFLSRSGCRSPGDLRGGTAKPFRNVNDREDDESAHGGMNKLGGGATAHVETLAPAKLHVAPKPPYAIIPTIAVWVSVAIGKKIAELGSAQACKRMIGRDWLSQVCYYTELNLICFHKMVVCDTEQF